MSTPSPSTNAPADQQVDIWAMQQALDEARKAGTRAEVPVGAVVMHAGQIIGRGHNAPVAGNDPTAHAEITALRAAARSRANYRLQDCTLYVTLEPCVMCAGAILNARVGRVVFGASDPKGGAAGSVVNLFANRRLNHRTKVQGGTLADACGALLRTFFQTRRQQSERIPLREDALRTPEAAFRELADYPWQPRYIRTLPALDGLRMHYLNEGPDDAPQTWLLLHGVPTWSYAYRHLMQALLDVGQHVLAPDLPGFGRSDKPKQERAHSFIWHAEILVQFVQNLCPQHVALVGFGLGADLAQALVMLRPDLCCSMLLLAAPPTRTLDKPHRTMAQFLRRYADEWTAAEHQAYAAPFPSRGFEAALRVADWNASASLRSLTPSASSAAVEPVTMAIADDGGGTGVSIRRVTGMHDVEPIHRPRISSAAQTVPECLRSAPAAQALVAALLTARGPHLRLL